MSVTRIILTTAYSYETKNDFYQPTHMGKIYEKIWKLKESFKKFNYELPKSIWQLFGILK